MKKSILFILSFLLINMFMVEDVNAVIGVVKLTGDSGCYTDTRTHCPYKGDGVRLYCIDYDLEPATLDQGGYELYKTTYDDVMAYLCKTYSDSSSAKTKAFHTWYNYNQTYSSDCSKTMTLNINDSVSKSLKVYDNNYYITNKITIEKSSDLSSYKVSLNNAPSGTIVVTSESSTTGLDLTKDQTSSSVYVKVPKSSIDGTVNTTLTVSSSGNYTCTKKSYKVDWYAHPNDHTGKTYQRFIHCAGEVDKEVTKNYSTSDSVNFTLNVGSLKIKKVDHDTNEPLSGIKFNLYSGKCSDANKTLAKDMSGKTFDTAVSDSYGIVTYNDLVPGDYCIEESQALNDYKILSEPVDVNVKSGSNEKVIANEHITVIISKKAITGEEEVVGATIEIADEEGNRYLQYESTSEPQIFVFEKGTYILTETIAPQGYKKIENSFKFNIDENGIITVLSEDNNLYNLEDNRITIYNDYAKMYISKKDITNVEELEGATIKISCENGYVEEFVSTKEEKELDVLPMVGSICILEEEIAPEGYEKVKSSLTFEIDENSNVKVIDKASDLYFVDGNKVVIYNGLFPDTGVYTWIGVGIIGAGLITGGTVIILREYKKKKNR